MRVYTVILDDATPTLRDLQASLTVRGKQEVAKAVGARLEFTIRKHLRTIAPKHHKTASRLGATPTGYLSKRNVESGHGPGGSIVVKVFGAIFARVDQDVNVSAKPGKALAIPAIAAAYGKRPREIGGLRLAIFVDKGKAALVKTDGSRSSKPLIFRKGGGPKKYGPDTKANARRKAFIGPRKERKKLKFKIYFWLKRGVKLSQDRGLLPSDEDFHKAMEQGAIDFLDMQARHRSGNGLPTPLK